MFGGLFWACTPSTGSSSCTASCGQTAIEKGTAENPKLPLPSWAAPPSPGEEGCGNIPSGNQHLLFSGSEKCVPPPPSACTINASQGLLAQTGARRLEVPH